jgi:hypothetical protein
MSETDDAHIWHKGVTKIHERAKRHWPDDGSYTPRVTGYHIMLGIIPTVRFGKQHGATGEMIDRAHHALKGGNS